WGSVGSALNPSTYNWQGANYNWGRTSTHEVGHWLNLRHIWGDDQGACTGTDFVADTPNQADEHYGCPVFPSVSCSNTPNGDMYMNYMDYTDDNCMNMFTTGQSTRMDAAINTYRSALASSLGCTPVGIFYPEAGLNASIFPNPANNELNIYLSRDKKTDIRVTLLNPLGEEIYSREISNSSEIKLAVDVSKYANGAYLLTLKTTEGTLTKKITVQH